MKDRVRAIILHNDSLVLVKRVKPQKEYYTFPGGGVEEGENLEQALIREVREEVGVEVEISELFIKRIFNEPGIVPFPEYFYICKIIRGDIGAGNGPEYQQDNGYEGSHSVVEIPIRHIREKDISLLPREIKELLIERWARR